MVFTTLRCRGAALRDATGGELPRLGRPRDRVRRGAPCSAGGVAVVEVVGKRG